MTGEPTVERSQEPRRTWKSKALEVVAIPLIGVVLAAIVQVIFPQFLDNAVLAIRGHTFGPYTVLRANDANAQDPPVISSITLTEYNGRLIGERIVPPDAARNIPPEGVRRVYTGFLGGDGYLVINYKSDPPLHGIGQLFLIEVDDGGYVGHARINICTHKGQIIKQCNVVLTKNQSIALKEYAQVLRQECQLVDFPSALDGRVAERAPCPESEWSTGDRLTPGERGADHFALKE
jgi:hypothetical protein